MKNEKREVRNRKEDAVLNRVLVWFGAAVVVEFIMLLLNRYYIHYMTTDNEINFAFTLSKILWPAALVCLIVAAACTAWWVSTKKKNGRTLVPTILTLTFAILFVCLSTTYWFQEAGVQLLCGAIPVIAVIALVYYLYQKEFFAVTVLCSVGFLGLWLVRKAAGGHALQVFGFLFVAAIVILLAILLFLHLQKNNGALIRGEKTFSIFPHQASYGILYSTCGIVAAVLAIACVFGTAVAYYLMFGLVAWVFITAVYFTVKLM